MIFKTPWTRRVMLLSLSGVLAGCASFSGDGGFDAVSTLTTERTGQPVRFVKPGPAFDTQLEAVTQLLAKPLSADSAVQIAWLNNPGLQANFADLGIAEADLVQAGRLRNPGFGFGRMHAGGNVEIERSIMFDLAGLLTMPMRRDIEKARFEQAKVQAAITAVDLAHRVRRAYFNAVAAYQMVEFMEQVRSSAEAGAELARRLTRIGNLNKLDTAREQLFYSEATAQLARSRHNAAAAREQLIRLLGLWGSQTTFTLPNRLPELPATVQQIGNVEQLAMAQRLDVQLAKLQAQATAQALGLSQVSGFVNVLHAGYHNKSASGAPRENGYEIELELPLFDWGGARNAKAQAVYMQSVQRTADRAITARSEVRLAYSAYRTTYDLARHYRDEVVPLRKQISEQVLLRYNGMLSSVFELLADACAQATSVNNAIEAQRDFWIAETDLQATINGSGAAPDTLRSAAPAAAGGPKH